MSAPQQVWTRSMVESLPADDRLKRAEVLEGELVVSPGADFAHEDLVMRIATQLRRAAPPEVAVLASGFAFHYDSGADNYALADITVARRVDCYRRGLWAPPLLLVEVLSTYSRRRDLLQKRRLYARGRVPAYWVVDADAPSFTVLHLADDGYDEQTTGVTELVTERPFPVRVDLLHD